MTDEARCERRFRAVSSWLSVAVVAIGLVVIAGWAFDLPALSRLRPMWTPMKPNTAILLVALGAGLWLLARQPRGTGAVRHALGLFVAVVGAATLVEYLFRVDLGIDQLVFHAPTHALFPQRMSPQTAVTVVVLGLGLGLDGWVSPSLVRAAGYVGLASGLVASFGYLYATSSLYELGSYTALTLHNAIAFVLAGAALLAARPAGGLVRLATSESDAGRVLRWLLPAILIVPVLTGWLELLGESTGQYDHRFLVALMTLTTVILLGVVAAILATSLERSDRAVQLAHGHLESSEQRFRALVEASAQIVWTANEQGQVDDSPTWRSFTGQTREQLAGLGWLDAVHPDDRDRVERAWHTSVRMRKSATMEYRVRHRDGDWRRLYVHAVPLTGADGKVRGWVGMSVDVTAKRLAQEGRMRQLREMVEHAPHSVAMLDTDLRFVEVSRPWLREFHVTEDIIGKHHYEVFPEIPERWRAVHTKGLAGHTETNEGEPFLRGDGRLQWVRWKVCPWRDLEGRIGGILIYSEDITAQRDAEEAARVTQEQLRLAQRVARIGTFDLDLVTGVNTWTPEAEALHGLAPGAFGRTQRAWVELVHPDDRAHALRLVDEAFATGEPTEGEWRVRWPDGSTHWIASRFQAFKDATGRQSRLIGINFEITERKEAEEQRERLLAEIRDLSKNLEARVEERTRELAVARDRLERDIAERMRLEEEQARQYAERAVLLKEIHHRVKNNLQVISSLFYLQGERTQNATVRRLLDESRGRLQTIALIHDKLYRSEHLAFIDFGEYLQDLTATLTSAIGIQAPNVSVRVEADHVFLDIDRAMPCALIINELVSNSIRHAFPGGRSGEVRIAVRQTDVSLDLEVADDGIGFPDDLDFRNVITLGLQLVTTLAHQLRAEVELERGGGTTFRIRLPLPAATQSDRAPQAVRA